MDGKKDIFDRLMGLKLLRPLWPFYVKYKEPLLYLFFGGLTTLISIFVFWLFNGPFGLNELVANLISWVLAVLFAFLTNKTWVFSSPNQEKSFFALMLSFYVGRLLTLGVEELLLFVFITWLGFNSMVVKILAQIVVIVLNYVISKLLVFRDKGEKA